MLLSLRHEIRQLSNSINVLLTTIMKEVGNNWCVFIGLHTVSGNCHGSSESVLVIHPPHVEIFMLTDGTWRKHKPTPAGHFVIGSEQRRLNMIPFPNHRTAVSMIYLLPYKKTSVYIVCSFMLVFLNWICKIMAEFTNIIFLPLT